MSYCQAGPGVAVRAAAIAACELGKLVSSAGSGCSDVAILALMCMLRALLLVSSAGSGWLLGLLLVSSAGSGCIYVATLALLCMLRVMLLVSSAGSGWCHIAKLALAWLCTLLGLLLVNSASL